LKAVPWLAAGCPEEPAKTLPVAVRVAPVSAVMGFLVLRK
jgi:hypothetical protein